MRGEPDRASKARRRFPSPLTPRLREEEEWRVVSGESEPDASRAWFSLAPRPSSLDPMASVCQFLRISSTNIRCSVCGTEREHKGNPVAYVRLCGAAPAGASTSPWTPLMTPCVHRGDVVERDVCNVCGMKGQPFEIHTCELHGRCMQRRYRNDRPGITVCMQCEDYQADEA
jgi:hypothetical protein